jgi:hypothetical protein
MDFPTLHILYVIVQYGAQPGDSVKRIVHSQSRLPVVIGGPKYVNSGRAELKNLRKSEIVRPSLTESFGSREVGFGQISWFFWLCRATRISPVRKVQDWR